MAAHPGLRDQLFTPDGELNRFVNVYVNGQDVRYLDGTLRRRSSARDELVILPAMAGGAADGRGRPAVGGPTPTSSRRSAIRRSSRSPRMSPKPAVRLFAKLEMANPTGSVKDRVAKALIEDLEHAGRSAADSIILEPTSGNTGIALAMIGRRQGYRVTLVMPDNVTDERRQLAALFGAEIIDSPGRLGSNGAIALAKELGRDRPALRHALPVRQRREPARPRGDHRTRDPGRLPRDRRLRRRARDRRHADGRRPLLPRARSRGVRIYAAEPLPGENVQGLRSLDEGFVPEIFDPTLLDGKYLVSNRDAARGAARPRRRARASSPDRRAGRCSSPRRAWPPRWTRGTIVALLPDGGWKYLSAGTYTRDLDEMEADLEGGVNWW